MKIIKTELDDCIVIQPAVFKDDRGFFQETYNHKRYSEQAGISYNFVQDNQSRSKKGVLRGLHFQKKNPQGKLVRVTRGEVFDVVVDIRKESNTFGKWNGVYLNEDNKKQLWVPPGFAHGFLVTSDIADFEYKCTSFYDPADEGSIIWNDPDLKIQWPASNPIVSNKDKQANLFCNL